MTTPEQADQQAQDAAKVVDMARRAFDRNRPLFIMVQYNHEADKLKFIDTIGELIQQHQLTTRRYDPLNNTEHGVSKLYPLLKRDRKEKTLSLVVSMPREKDSDKLDNEFVSYINLYRDFIAQQKLHFVLFLRESEMGDFIGDAGDLWSFRHRTFRLERELTKSTEMLWQNVEQMQTQLTFTDEENQLIKDHLRSTKQLIEETKDTEDKALLWLGLTQWLLRHNAPKMAIEIALEGIALLDNQACDVLGTLENELGCAFQTASALPEALNHYKEALNISLGFKNRQLQAIALHNISQIYDHQGDYDRSLFYLKQSLPIAQDVGDKQGEGVILNSIAEVLFVKGDYDTALQLWQQSLSIRQDIGDEQGEAATLNNIALHHKLRNDYDTALNFYEQSLLKRRISGDKQGEATTLNNIAEVHRENGGYDTALRLFNQSLLIRKDNGDKKGEGSTLNNISRIYDAKGDSDIALQFLNQALSIHKDIGNNSGLCITFFNMGHIHWRNGEQQEAISDWLTAYQTAKPMGLAQVLDGLADLSEKVGLPPGLEGWEKLSKEQQASE